MATPEMVQVRRAALLLHGLSPSMRAQVIARLDSAESAFLKPVLAELTDLGVSQSVGQDLRELAFEPQAGMSPSTQRALTVLEQVERLSPEDVARCLESCAPMTAAHLMRAGNWSWKARALDLMPDTRRAVIFECMRSAAPVLAPAVLNVLCERLCACAAGAQLDHAQADSSPVRADGNVWSTWLTTVRVHLARSFGWMR